MSVPNEKDIPNRPTGRLAAHEGIEIQPRAHRLQVTMKEHEDRSLAQRLAEMNRADRVKLHEREQDFRRDDRARKLADMPDFERQKLREEEHKRMMDDPSHRQGGGNKR